VGHGPEEEQELAAVLEDARGAAPRREDAAQDEELEAVCEGAVARDEDGDVAGERGEARKDVDGGRAAVAAGGDGGLEGWEGE
jgi:hypothetical protein